MKYIIKLLWRYRVLKAENKALKLEISSCYYVMDNLKGRLNYYYYGN